MKSFPSSFGRAPLCFAAFSVATLMTAAGCPGEPEPDGGIDPAPESSGVIVEGDEEKAFTFDAAESDFIVTVGLVPGLLCNQLHEHAVEAGNIGLEFSLDPNDAANSTMVATVAAAGLVPDEPEIREQYLEGLSQEPVPEGDRNSIRGSVLSSVGAEEHPTLLFSATNFSDLSPGATGTVDVTATVNGGTQTITMDYTLTQDGENYLFDASGTLPGGPHDIPSGFASECVDPDLGLFLKLLLVPGENDAEIDAGVIVYEQETFPFDGACDENSISFNEARDVVVAKCAGCHANPPVNGATVPLAEYNDFRVDSFRHPSEPLYLTAEHFMARPIDNSEGLPMPPQSASQLTDEERQLANDWIAQGAPDCLDLADPVTFTTQTEATCGDVSYDDDIKPIVDNYCIGCHSNAQTEIPALESYEQGTELGVHAYYEPLVLWEASLYRILDHSMPTYSTPEFPVLSPTETQLFQTWVETGYPQVRCE